VAIALKSVCGAHCRPVLAFEIVIHWDFARLMWSARDGDFLVIVAFVIWLQLID
jgi:hypothetical protein